MTKIKDAIMGFVVGDALGVPYEFVSREELKMNPAKDMVGYGTYNQPAGTWSDDTAMTLCVIENIINDGKSHHLAQLFIKWYKEGYYTATNEFFDIGITTRIALDNIIAGKSPSESGLRDINSCGNGSLMRSTPYAFLINFNKTMVLMNYNNRITHGHPLCHECCFLYCKLLQSLSNGKDKHDAFRYSLGALRQGWRLVDLEEIDYQRIQLFDRMMSEEFVSLKEEDIKSTGYVLHSLEAAIWCFLNTDNYETAVLKAVNLGGDTDTIAALTGAMAGTYYGYDAIPKKWLDVIAKKDEIELLLSKFI